MTAGAHTVSPSIDPATLNIEARHEEIHRQLLDQGLIGTDLGLSYLFSMLYADQLGYCAAEGCWYVWNGQRWTQDQTRRAESLLQQMLRDMMALDTSACGARPSRAQDRDGGYRRRRRDEDEDEFSARSPRSILAAWAWRSAKAGTVRGVLALAQADEDLAVTPDDFDADPALFGVANGVLELSKSGVKHRPATQGDMLTMSSPVVYSVRAKCPKFEKFYAEILGGDVELMGWLQRMLGSCLSGVAARDQVLPVLQGNGANGKSTLMSLIAHVLGDYAQQADAKLITIQRGDRGVPLDVHRIRRARLVNIVEPSQEVDLDEGRIKQLTGGEPIVHRMHRQAEQTSIPGYKLVLQTNPLPRVAGSDKGIWRRIQIVPFRRTFDGAAKNPRLLAELKEEAPGVLRWLAEGFAAWVTQGLGTCPAVEDASAAVRSETDSIGSFMVGSCRPDPAGEAPARALYTAYERWCHSVGARPKSETAFGRTLTAMGHTIRETRSGRYRVGLVLEASDAD